MSVVGIQASVDADEIVEPGEGGPVRRARPLRGAAVGAGLIAVLLILSYVPFSYSPTTPSPGAILVSPNGHHWFGTDQAGYDIFARTLSAAHTDIPIAIGGTLVALVVGTLLGLVASLGGRAGVVIMRSLDLFQAFPLLILILVIVTLTKGGIPVIIVSVAIANVPAFVRLTRGEALAVRESRFVFYARVVGSSRWAIIRRHLLPNATGVILAQASIGCATAVGVIAAISFLGAGVPPPQASWGSMIQSGAEGIGNGQWWPVVFPGAALGVTIFSLNLVSDRLGSYFSRVTS